MTLPSWSSYGVDTVHTGEGFLTLVPKHYRADGTVPGVLFCHGAGDGAYNGALIEGTVPSVRNIVFELAGLYPVLSCDLGGQYTWGNSTVISRVTEAKTYLQGTMGAKAGKIVLVGLSMGNLSALAWAAANLTSVSCAVGIIPCCDLTDMRTNNRGGYQAVIDAAYGGLYVAATYQAAHNPAYIATQGGYAGLPYKAWYGSSDAVAIASTVTGLVSAIGGTASAVQAATSGHVDATVAAITPSDVSDFIRQYA